MRHNKTKEKLRKGEAVFGCFVRYPDPALVEFLGYTGWDFLMFDGEHGTIEPRSCEDMTRSAQLRDVTPIVRVPVNQPSVILRFLDTGVEGLHIPMVNSGPDAEAAVRSVKYHPRGIRGLATVRAADYGQREPLAEYVKQANDETLVIVHIETAGAVEHLPEILAVDGVDVLFIGPTDLSHSFGFPGEPQNPKVQEAISRIVDAVAKSSLAVGILVPNAAAAQEWRKRGARYIAVGFEALAAPACRNYLSQVR